MDEDEDPEDDAESSSGRLCTTPQLILMLPTTPAKVVQISFGTPLFISSYRGNQYSDWGGLFLNQFLASIFRVSTLFEREGVSLLSSSVWPRTI